MTPATPLATVIRWRPGFHDQDIIGWVIFAGYFVAAFLCFRAARATDSAGDPAAGRVRTFWYILTLLLILLGINKQLDLQTLMTEVGREAARAEGWYQSRRTVQAAFIAALALLSVIILSVVGFMTRKSLFRVRFALAGILLLTCFVLIRAASFHHVDRALGLYFAGMRISWTLELTGIVAVGACALLDARRHGARPAPQAPA